MYSKLWFCTEFHFWIHIKKNLKWRVNVEAQIEIETVFHKAPDQGYARQTQPEIVPREQTHLLLA